MLLGHGIWSCPSWPGHATCFPTQGVFHPMWHTSLSLWDSLYSWGDKASPQENESIMGSYELRDVFKALEREPCDCFCREISLRIDWAGRLLLGAGGDCFPPWKKPGNSTGRLGKKRQHVQVKGIIITFPLSTWWRVWEGVSLAHHPILTHLLGCTQVNPDLWKSHDALSLGNLFGLVILWQYSVVTSSGFSAPLCSRDWISWDWAPLSGLLTLSLIVFFIARMWSPLFY